MESAANQEKKSTEKTFSIAQIHLIIDEMNYENSERDRARGSVQSQGKGSFQALLSR